MIQVEKLKAWHLAELSKDETADMIRPLLGVDHFLAAEQDPFAYTAMKGLDPIACVGVREYWPGRGEMWSILGEASRTEMLPIFRAASRLLAECPVRRIEVSVAVDFEPGHRFAKMLGFELEAPCLKAFFPDGTDAALYSRVRNP